MIEFMLNRNGVICCYSMQPDEDFCIGKIRKSKDKIIFQPESGVSINSEQMSQIISEMHKK